MKMKREILMSVVAVVLLGVCVFIYASSGTGITFFAISEDGVCSDTACISENFVLCTPARMTWTSDSGDQKVTATMEVIGIVDDQFCEFKMTSDDRTLRECYFPIASLSDSLAEQFFKGKDNGFGLLISDSCK